MGGPPEPLFPNGVDYEENSGLVLDQRRHCALLYVLERTKKVICGLKGGEARISRNEKKTETIFRFLTGDRQVL